MDNDPIQHTIQRTRRYWYIDGLSEIGAGSVICLVALFYALLGLLPPSSPYAAVLGIGQIVVVLVGYWAAGKIVRMAKIRLTYPRTGYVSYPPRRGRRRLLLALTTFGVALGFAFIFTWLIGRLPENLLPAITGGIISLTLVYLGYRTGVPRFYLVAAFTFVLGAATSSLGLPDPWSNVLFFGGFGLAWTISGVVTLIGYLHATRPLSEGGEA
jgi:hypothetical protein